MDKVDIILAELNEIIVSDKYYDSIYRHDVGYITQMLDGIFTPLRFRSEPIRRGIINDDYKIIYDFLSSHENNKIAVFCKARICYYKMNKKKEGIALYEKACELENADAMYYLGTLYYNGDNYIKINYKKAFYYFNKAEKHNYKPVFYYIPEMYIKGIGTEKNTMAALKSLKSC